MSELPRRFNLLRKEDFSGVSGTGTIAEGIEFTDGSCVMRWKTDKSSTAIYKNIVELEAIHGHEGRTQVVWIDH